MSVVSPDLPITSVSQDRLGVSALVDKIVSLLVERAGGEWRATRLVIGLTGAWGSGKSSILNLVKSQIDSLDNVVTVSFNPWIFQGSDDLIRSFLDELSKQLKKSKSEKLKELASTFQDYGDAIGTIVDLKVPGAGAILKNVISRKSQPSLTDSRDKLIKKLNEANGAIVVLIDELDRVEPSEIKSMARLMKAVADLRSVSYLVGYDRKRVELALSSSESDGHLYLKKIVQIALPIRPLIDSEVVEILAEGMTNANLDPGLGDPDLSRHLISIISRNIDTPRDINRLLSLYSALSSMMEGEIDLCDLLAYCALATHNPAIRDLLADKIDAFVNDPTEFEYYVQNRSSSSKKPSAVLSIVMDSYTERLLEFMFPVFGGKSDSDRFGRVQSKLNLLAVLYMGNPPFRLSRKETSAELNRLTEASIHEMFKSGTLFDLIGNLSLMAATYPRDGLEDKILKIALYLQTRQGEESLRARQCLVNLRDIIHGLVKADRNGSEVAQRILAALRKNGERFLSAMILRNHMYSFGMIDSQTRRLIPQFISKDQLAIYIQEDRQKLSDVITEGFWQDRAASSSVFYLLEQSGSFDKKLRKSLAEQIKTPEGIVALAAVFCPPGIVIGREAVQRFVDLDLVEEMLALAKPISRYHQSSIENLRETVREEVADT